MASSQLVSFSSGSHVSPNASARPARVHLPGPQQDMGLAVAHLELEQLRHLVLRRTVRANDGGGRAGLAAKVRWAADVTVGAAGRRSTLNSLNTRQEALRGGPEPVGRCLAPGTRAP